MNLATIRQKADRLMAQYESAQEQLEADNEALSVAQERVRYTEEAQALIQQVAKSIQQAAHGRIAGTVSNCLAAVFDNPYLLDIAFEEKRGRTEAVLSFVRDGEHFDPMTDTSGGVKALAALALRVIKIVSSRPPMRRLLVADEPFVHVSPDLLPKIPKLLMGLAEELKLQIILTTNIKALECGKVVRLSGQNAPVWGKNDIRRAKPGTVAEEGV